MKDPQVMAVATAVKQDRLTGSELTVTRWSDGEVTSQVDGGPQLHVVSDPGGSVRAWGDLMRRSRYKVTYLIETEEVTG